MAKSIEWQQHNNIVNMNVIPIKNAYVCGECDCISEGNNEQCPCGSKAIEPMRLWLAPLPEIRLKRAKPGIPKPLTDSEIWPNKVRNIR